MAYCDVGFNGIDYCDCSCKLRGTEDVFLKGRQYVYIKEAYGKLVGFYTGGVFAVIQTGTIAAVGVVSKFYLFISSLVIKFCMNLRF
jgi:hypothetical protein